MRREGNGAQERAGGERGGRRECTTGKLFSDSSSVKLGDINDELAGASRLRPSATNDKEDNLGVVISQQGRLATLSWVP